MRKTRRVPRARLAGALAAAAFATSLVLLGAASGQEPAAAAPSRLTLADWELSPAETRGRTVYETYCIGCHGDGGRGDGPASRFLDPLPRDFQAGKFKFRSTPFGEMPLESDLMRTVTCGLPGSSMPGFQLVPELERRDVVRYVLSLARLGDGPSSYALRDWQDAAIRPRDLTTGVFRAGSTAEDVFVRIKTGLSGTPMPSSSNLPDDRIWDLVHFVRSLERPHATKPRAQPGCEHEGSAR